jgi:hypothetical protein
MTNFTDLAVDSLVIGANSKAIPAPAAVQTLTGATGTITKTSGVVVLNKAGAITVTLNLPVADTDDGKVLEIVSLTAQLHTVALASGTFGGSGAGYTTVTFTGAVGDSMTVVAFNGKWYILQLNHATIA